MLVYIAAGGIFGALLSFAVMTWTFGFAAGILAAPIGGSIFAVVSALIAANDPE